MTADRYSSCARPVLAAILLLAAKLGCAQNLGSLKTVAVPRPAGLDTYVRDQKLLIVLGKALFWDMQAGSDARVRDLKVIGT